MSYLDNNTIIVDSILTKRGRELFAQGKFNITKFALSDDEIDYNLYNELNPQGSEYYAQAIENLPVLEALPDGTKLMKYKLVTLPKGTTEIPIISVPSTNITLYAVKNDRSGQSAIIVPSTINGLNDVHGYTATISNPELIKLEVVETVRNQPEIIKFKSYQPGYSAVGKSFKVTSKVIPQTTTTTTLIISGNETGGSVEITITINNGVITSEE